MEISNKSKSRILWYQLDFRFFFWGEEIVIYFIVILAFHETPSERNTLGV